MVCRRSSVRGATRWRHRAVRGQDDRRADRRLPVRKEGGEGRQRWLALPKLSCGSRALLSRIRRDAWRSRSSGDGTCCGAQSAASVAPSRSACSSGRAIRVARRSCPSSFGLAVDQGVVEGDAAGLMLWLGVLAVVYVGLSFSFRYGARAGERASLTAAHLLRVALVERVLAPEGGAEDGRLPGELANIATEDAKRVGAVSMAVRRRPSVSRAARSTPTVSRRPCCRRPRCGPGRSAARSSPTGRHVRPGRTPPPERACRRRRGSAGVRRAARSPSRCVRGGLP